MASHIVLFGPPGVGKGTQAERLRDGLGLAHISTGEILRANIREGTALGMKAKSYMDAGKLVPDDLVIALVEERLKEPSSSGGFLLDGFPRTVEQLTKLEAMLEHRGTPIDAVVYFTAPDPVLIGRISGRRMCRTCGATFHADFAPPRKAGVCDKCNGELYQRSDDNESSVAERLRQYRAMSEPLVARFEASGRPLHRIDATRSPAEVYDSVAGVLGAA